MHQNAFFIITLLRTPLNLFVFPSGYMVLIIMYELIPKRIEII